MGKGIARSVARVSLGVREDIRREAPRHPDLVGLPKGASRAKVLERLLEIGWETARRDQLHRQQLALYAAFAQDEEQRAVARADHEAIIRGSVV